MCGLETTDAQKVLCTCEIFSLKNWSKFSENKNKMGCHTFAWHSETFFAKKICSFQISSSIIKTGVGGYHRLGCSRPEEVPVEGPVNALIFGQTNVRTIFMFGRLIFGHFTYLVHFMSNLYFSDD
jgi:hypothetical protein